MEQKKDQNETTTQKVCDMVKFIQYIEKTKKCQRGMVV